MRRLFPVLLLLASQGCAFPPSRGPATAAPAPAAPSAEPPAESPAPSEAAPAEAAPAPASTVESAPEEAHPEARHDEEEEGDEAEAEVGHAARTTAKIDLSDEQLADKARHDLAALGPISAGTPGAGWLVNGVQMPRGEQWDLIGAPHVWGTQETIDFLVRAIGDVNKRFPNTPPLAIGHVSSHHGGHLSPHKSHQAGRDVDLGFYYSHNARWFARGTAQNLDLPRTWALVKALINETDVEMIFIDTSIQHLLSQHAAAAGEDAAFLDRVFQTRGKSNAPIVRHVKGHATHIHVRFNNPTAQEMYRRAQRFLKRPAVAVAHKSGPGAPAAASGDSTQYVSHRARNGDVLVNLARQYNTTPEAIARANGLHGTALKVGQTYKIPVPAKAAAVPAKGNAPGKPTHVAGRSRG